MISLCSPGWPSNLLCSRGLPGTDYLVSCHHTCLGSPTLNLFVFFSICVCAWVPMHTSHSTRGGGPRTTLSCHFPSCFETESLWHLLCYLTPSVDQASLELSRTFLFKEDLHSSHFSLSSWTSLICSPLRHRRCSWDNHISLDPQVRKDTAMTSLSGMDPHRSD